MSSPSPEPKKPALQKTDKSNDSLYEARKKLYVRSVTGLFANWRWALVWLTQLIFYGLPWLQWNERQAVLFHLAERKFYIFGWVFWPQDVLFLALLLIISAFALFFFTAVAGRLWCGYACPQTVYTEIFMWIEEKFEGNHMQRQRLDKAPLSSDKVLRRGGKYVAWILVSLWTGFTFVAYFSPLKELLAALPRFEFGPWELFWILFYGGMTYLFAGLMREQVCKYMCPYARFQAVMFDPDTLVITYDEARGEPRGPRRKGVEPASVGKGDCIDCAICVQVCPTGIDIRNGLQYECIGCAACIDACDQVMDRMGYPRGLIRYSTEQALQKGWGKKEILRHVVRPRTLVYGFVLAVMCVGFIYLLIGREPLRMDIIRDRSSLGREIEGGLIENVYSLQVMNMTERARSYHIEVSGLPGIRITTAQQVDVDPASTESLTTQVVVPYDEGEPGANPITFRITAADDPRLSLDEKATFLIPR